MKNIIFSGGYHTGRKLLLNSILQEDRFMVFESTTILQSETMNGVKYTETPPVFSDKEIKHNTNALVQYVLHTVFSEGQGPVFLVFVVLREGNTIRDCDVSSIKVAIRALQAVGLQTARKFAVLVNKVDKRFCRKKKLQNEFSKQVSAMFWSNGIFVSPDNVGFVSSERIRFRPGANTKFLKCESWASFIEKAPALKANTQSFPSFESPLPMQQPTLNNEGFSAIETPACDATIFRQPASILCSPSSTNGDIHHSNQPNSKSFEQEFELSSTPLSIVSPTNSTRTVRCPEVPVDSVQHLTQLSAPSSSEYSVTTSALPVSPPIGQCHDLEQNHYTTHIIAPTPISGWQSDTYASRSHLVDRNTAVCNSICDKTRGMSYDPLSCRLPNVISDQNLLSLLGTSIHDQERSNSAPRTSSSELRKLSVIGVESDLPDIANHPIPQASDISPSKPISKDPYVSSPSSLAINDLELPLEAQGMISDIQKHDEHLSKLQSLQRKYDESRIQYKEAMRETENILRKVNMEVQICQSHIAVLKSSLQPVIDEARQKRWRETNKKNEQGTKERPECTICLEDIERKNALSLPCGHVFHSICVNKWIVKKKSCPICKLRVN